MSENLKKYFIKDSELTSIDQDKLSSKDIAKNIGLIIDNTKPPFAVAVTGKSGIGKSSIINLVSEKYKNNPENYNVQKINVWKDEEISLKSILNGYENNQTYLNEELSKNTTNAELKSDDVNKNEDEQKSFLEPRNLRLKHPEKNRSSVRELINILLSEYE